MNEIVIDDHRIGSVQPPFIIAEVGINHNGSIEMAKKMIDVAKEAGVDAVKFQTFKATEFCGDPEQTFSYQSQGKTVTESMLAMFQRNEFAPDQWTEISAYCKQAGITFFSTPQNRSDLDVLLKVGVPAIKVGSDDFTNLPLLKSYAEAELPMILSCGMSDIAEVQQGLEAAGWFGGRQVVLLLCTSQYPTPPADVNALKLKTLQQAFPGLVVGFSDHTQGPVAATVAAALGAKIFEKHFTLDHNLPGPDHWFSEDPAGLKEWVDAIRSAHTMLGSPLVRPTEAELQMRLLARRSVVSLRPIKRGEAFSDQNVGLRRPGTGLQPGMLAEVLGAVATRDIEAGTPIVLDDMLTKEGAR